MDDLLTTAEVASSLRRSQDWVREHAAELGGIRLGGPRSPLGFEPSDIAAYKERQRLCAPAPPERKPQRAGRRRAPAGVELVPLPAGR